MTAPTRLLFLDHFDSFSANLVAFFKDSGFEVEVIQTNKIDASILDPIFINSLAGVIFSPGPKHPKDYPCSLAFYKTLPAHMPVLGVCLGHQLMLYADNATVQVCSENPVHGRRQLLEIDACRSAPDGPFLGSAIFYNSLAVSKTDAVFKNTIWRCVKAVDNWSVVAEHMQLPRLGLQFHPESFASTIGSTLLQSFTKHFFVR